MKPYIIALALIATPAAFADQRVDDIRAIKAVVLKHTTSWEYGRKDDMQASMSPHIGHKGIIHGNLALATAAQLVEWTGAREGIKVENPIDYQVEVLDLFRDGATVKVESRESVDYLHMGRGKAGWVIMNYLYQLKQEPPVKPD